MDVEQDVGAAVEHVGVGGVESAEGGFVAADEDVATGGAGGDLLELEDVAGDVGHLCHSVSANAGQVDSFFDEGIQAFAILGGVFGDERGVRLHGDGEDVGHAGEDARCGFEVDVVEIELDRGVVGDAGVEGDGDAVFEVDSADDVLSAGAEMEALDAGGDVEFDGAIKGGCLGAEVFLVDVAGEGTGVYAVVLGDDVVVGIEGTGLGEELVGAGVIAHEAGLGGLLYELGEVMLAGDGEGESVLLLVGVELHGAGEAALGGDDVVVFELACALEVSIVGIAGLAGGDGGRFGLGVGDGAGLERAGGNADGGGGVILRLGGGWEG